MQFRNLLDQEEDRAVSPVIGVILMVAITVILAAVIGTFVLGLGDQVQQTAPNTNIAFDYDASGNGNLTVTHDGGDGIEAQNLVLTGSALDVNSTGEPWSAAATGDYQEGDVVRAGDSMLVDDDDTTVYGWDGGVATTGDEVRVVWRGEGDRSSTLRTFTVP